MIYLWTHTAPTTQFSFTAQVSAYIVSFFNIKTFDVWLVTIACDLYVCFYEGVGSVCCMLLDI